MRLILTFLTKTLNHIEAYLAIINVKADNDIPTAGFQLAFLQDDKCRWNLQQRSCTGEYPSRNHTNHKGVIGLKNR